MTDITSLPKVELHCGPAVLPAAFDRRAALGQEIDSWQAQQ